MLFTGIHLRASRIKLPWTSSLTLVPGLPMHPGLRQIHCLVRSSYLSGQIAVYSFEIHSDFHWHQRPQVSFSTFWECLQRVLTNRPISGGANIPASMTTLFNLQESLYNAGARNFLFINVPPMSRAPFSMYLYPFIYFYANAL